MARAKQTHHHNHKTHHNHHNQAHGGHGNNNHETGEHEIVRDAQRAALASFGAFDMFGGPMARLMEHNRAMLQKMFHVMHEESLRFVNRRLEHTSQAIESSRDCQGISGLMAVQQEWILDFTRDCAEQSKRFAALMHEIAEDGSASMSEVSAEVTERRAAEEHHRAAA